MTEPSGHFPSCCRPITRPAISRAWLRRCERHPEALTVATRSCSSTTARGTARSRAIRAAAAANPAVRYLSFTRNFGHQAALRAGLRHARGARRDRDGCGFRASAGTHSATGRRLARRRQGRGDPARRRRCRSLPPLKSVTSPLYYQLLDAIGDVRIEPGSADFMLLDRSVVDTINGFARPGRVPARRWCAGSAIRRRRITFSRGARTYGDSKYTLRRMIDLAVTGIAAHSVRPLRLAIWLALGFAAAGFLLLIYSVVSFFLVERTVTGWTSLMATVAMLGAAQLLVLGIIGEYVGRILREARGRPTYVSPRPRPISYQTRRMRRSVQSAEWIRPDRPVIPASGCSRSLVGWRIWRPSVSMKRAKFGGRGADRIDDLIDSFLRTSASSAAALPAFHWSTVACGVAAGATEP